MQPLVQSLVLGGTAAAAVIAALPHLGSENTPLPDEKRTETVRATSGGLLPAQARPPGISTQPVIHQYHVQVIEPPAGWKGHMPCLRPPASFRTDMPCLRPEGILGTNRVVTPPVRIIVRPR